MNSKFTTAYTSHAPISLAGRTREIARAANTAHMPQKIDDEEGQ